jgi:hypothetical protein
MTTFAKAFDPTVPTGTTLANTADDTLRDDKFAIDERYSLEHQALTSIAGGNTAAANAPGRHKPGFVSAVYLGASAPASTVQGAMWYDTSQNKLNIYNASTTSWTTYQVTSPAVTSTANYFFMGYATSYPSGGTSLFTAITSVGSLYSGGTFTAPYAGVYLLTLTYNVKYADAHTTARHTSGVTVTIGGNTFYLIVCSQNYAGGSSTLGTYKAGASSGSISLTMTAGQTFTLAHWHNKNDIADAVAVTPEVSNTNIFTFSLIRAL